MKDYIIAWAITAALTVGGLFGVGFVVGIIMGATGNAQGVDHLEQAAWFNILVLLAIPLINFFAFRFATKRLIVRKMNAL